MRIAINMILIFLASFHLQAESSLDRFKEANELYQAEEYANAISIYESILEEGKSSADLHYNLANAYFREREIAKAILHYEKALKLEPTMADAKHNLEFANSKTIDKIETPAKIFFYRWWDSILHACSCDTWAIISLICLAIAVLAIGGYFFMSLSGRKKLFFYSAVGFTAMFILSWIISASYQNSLEKSNYAIILSPTVNINSSPSEGSSKLFVLHEGTKVKLGEESGDWREISLPNGNEGWVKVSVLGEI